MVVVMAPEATQADVNAIVDLVQTAGGEAFVSRGVARTIIGLVGDVDQFGTLNLRSRTGVGDVVRISVPYKLVSREHHPSRSVITVAACQSARIPSRSSPARARSRPRIRRWHRP